jgi:hypothetical protein
MIKNCTLPPKHTSIFKLITKRQDSDGNGVAVILIINDCILLNNTEHPFLLLICVPFDFTGVKSSLATELVVDLNKDMMPFLLKHSKRKAGEVRRRIGQRLKL